MACCCFCDDVRGGELGSTPASDPWQGGGRVPRAAARGNAKFDYVNELFPPQLVFFLPEKRKFFREKVAKKVLFAIFLAGTNMVL